MPSKLQFQFKPDGKNDEALLGRNHRVDIMISKNKNVAISSLKLQIEKIEFSDLTGHLRQVDLTQDSNLMESVDMDVSQITQQAQANEKRRFTNVSKYQGPPRSSALNQSILLGTVMQVNRKQQPNSSTYDTETQDSDMKSKIENLFGNTQDEVSSDYEENIKSQLSQNEFDIQFCFKDQPLSYLKYPSQNFLDFSQDSIKVIQDQHDGPNLSLLFTFYGSSISKIDLNFVYTFTQD